MCVSVSVSLCPLSECVLAHVCLLVLPGCAEAREESLSLAKQLAAANAQLQRHKTAATKLQTKLEAEGLLRSDAEQAAEMLRQRLEKLLSSSRGASEQRNKLAQVCTAGRRLGEFPCRMCDKTDNLTPIGGQDLRASGVRARCSTALPALCVREDTRAPKWAHWLRGQRALFAAMERADHCVACAAMQTIAATYSAGHQAVCLSF